MLCDVCAGVSELAVEQCFAFGVEYPHAQLFAVFLQHHYCSSLFFRPSAGYHRARVAFHVFLEHIVAVCVCGYVHVEVGVLQCRVP